ncbi:monooxygenase, partial [Streptomyces sp. SID7499]|nr:monooxygenase [Streptomyces sp. SID7499]
APSADARYGRGWLIAQWRLEGILRDRLAGYGVRVEPGREVVGLAQGRNEDESGSGSDGDYGGHGAYGGHVDVTYADGPAGRARYVVGCDGAHSSVRK